MAAYVYITSGPRERAGYFRCDKNGAPQVTTRRHAERFADERGAQSAVALLAKMQWLAEVRED